MGIEDHGDYFTDTNSNLDWLDVTLTLNRSFDDISSQLSKGGEFEGWRFAYTSELATMVTNTTGIGHGITGPRQSNYNENEQYQLLISTLGNTLDAGYQLVYQREYDTYGGTGNLNFDYTSGWVADSYGLTRHYLATIADIDDNNNSSPDLFRVTDIYYNYASDYYRGSYLIRESAVPLPSTLPLMVTGIILLLSIQRRRD